MLECNDINFRRIFSTFTILFLIVCRGSGLLSPLQNRQVRKEIESIASQIVHNILPGEEIDTGPAATTLSINASKEIHPFRAGMRGANLGNWTFFWSRPYPNDSPKLRELAKLIKPGVLRYAGGLLSNDVPGIETTRSAIRAR